VRELVRDIDEACAVQEQFIGSLEDLRTEVVGRKIGLTSREVQRVMGVDTPTSGLLARSMRVANGATVPAARFLQPRVEAEIAFVLASDVHEPTDRDHLVSCIEAVAPALEIADSRIRDWDISVLDTVADNASGAGFVLGPLRVPRDCPDLREVEMTLRCNYEVVGAGRGDACLGDPLEALAWLARTSRARESAPSRGDRDERSPERTRRRAGRGPGRGAARRPG
jgi:2-keto-4-pentenoate hydratase